MTKFILNSGGLKKNPATAKKYFTELLEGLGTEPKLLWCFFATLPDPPEERFEKYVEIFADYFPDGINPVHENAQVETFEQQVHDCDAIYLHGGSIAPLKEILEPFNITELFAGKRVGTNSASSMVLAKYAWSCDTLDLKEGLGFFPIKFIAHYKAEKLPDNDAKVDWDAAHKELEAYGDQSLPIYALEEGEYVVFEV